VEIYKRGTMIGGLYLEEMKDFVFINIYYTFMQAGKDRPYSQNGFTDLMRGG